MQGGSHPHCPPLVGRPVYFAGRPDGFDWANTDPGRRGRRPLSALSCLKLSGNPMEFLPELSPCTSLRHLTLANVRVKANSCMNQVGP